MRSRGHLEEYATQSDRQLLQHKQTPCSRNKDCLDKPPSNSVARHAQLLRITQPTAAADNNYNTPTLFQRHTLAHPKHSPSHSADEIPYVVAHPAPSLPIPQCTNTQTPREAACQSNPKHDSSLRLASQLRLNPATADVSAVRQQRQQSRGSLPQLFNTDPCHTTTPPIVAAKQLSLSLPATPAAAVIAAPSQKQRSPYPDVTSRAAAEDDPPAGTPAGAGLAAGVVCVGLGRGKGCAGGGSAGCTAAAAWAGFAAASVVTAAGAGAEGGPTERGRLAGCTAAVAAAGWTFAGAATAAAGAGAAAAGWAGIPAAAAAAAGRTGVAAVAGCTGACAAAAAG